jgi:polyribonucleotide nucleotidyltransferase
MVIGKGGETIRSLEADYEVQIDIEEDGTIRIYGTNGELAENARQAIDSMTKEIEVGEEFTGEVVKIADFGAFVNLKKGVDGLLHVSRILPKGQRLASAEQVFDRGDMVRVSVTEVDKDRGRIGLTLVAKVEDGADITPEDLVAVAEANPAPERQERGRDGRGGGGGGRDRDRGRRRDR